MAEYSYIDIQTVGAGESVLFENGSRVCRRGYILHRDEAGLFKLQGGVRGCKAVYEVSFGANIAVPTGSAVGEISIALTQDGEVLQNALARETPAAVEEYSNVFVATTVESLCGCCIDISVRNTSGIPINVQNANIIIKRIA